MARQQVDIGIEGNDGTGDSIRESFRKVNENFQEIYAVVGKGGQITFTLLADTPDSLTPFKGDGVDAYLPIVKQDGTGIEVRKLGSNSDENPAEIDTISVSVSEAGKIILAISIVLWVLASYGPGENFNSAESIVKTNPARSFL